VRLSDAIRLGAMTTRQAFNSYFVTDASGEVQKTCAIGAAAFAVGYVFTPGYDCIPSVLRRWPILNTKQFDPVEKRARILVSVIVDLNDEHHWSRGQIADWVATIELPIAERTDHVVTDLATQAQ
jgi:hypothetical protein